MSFLRRRAIRPWALWLFSALLLGVLGAGTASPAGARTPQAAPAAPTDHLVFVVRVFAPSGRPISLDEAGSIVAAMEGPIDFARQKTGWRCVLPPSFEFPVDPDELPPLADIGIKIVYGPAPDGDGIVVTTTVLTRGKQLGEVGMFPIAPANLDDDHRSRALADGAAAAFDRTQADKSSPCGVPHKALNTRGRFGYREGGPDGFLDVSQSWEGSVEIPPVADGIPFTAGGHARVTQSFHSFDSRGDGSARGGRGGPLECQGSWSGEEVLQVSGLFDDTGALVMLNDLKFWVDFGQQPDPLKIPVTCAPASARRSPTEQLPFRNPLELASPDSPIALPLVDQSEVKTPRPVRADGIVFNEWQSTIEVQDSSSEDDSPPSAPVAAGPVPT